MGNIITRDRSVVPACDVPLDVYLDIVKGTADVEGIGGYKVGFFLGLNHGLPEVVKRTREFTDKPIIYDHQKAGTDIHESTNDKFMDAMHTAGIDAVILFPQAGPVTQYEWTRAAQERDLGVIVGGEMTHPRYLDGDRSNGKKDYNQIFEELEVGDLSGYIKKGAPGSMYMLAAKMGVEDFVMPGNKPEMINRYLFLVQDCGIRNPSIWSPGLVAQGGTLKSGAEAAGKSFHGIVGRGIYTKDDKRAAAIELTQHL